jgi:GTP-binding protein HflX
MIMLKFSSKSISEHAEAPLPDDGRLEALVEHFRARAARTQPAGGAAGNAAYVVSVGADRDEAARRAQLDEIVSLVGHQGDRVVGHEIARAAEPNPRTYLGTGGARDIAAHARALGADMLVLDAELTPSQTRNLEDVAGMPICDREAVILNVFLRHARTRRAKVQVEIAQLEYLRPRIRGVGIDMDQQTGGMARARGPGETASELLARKLDARLSELQKTLRKLETSSATQRKQRDGASRLVLVGYTNAGKTSLMNALTSAELSARDMPFETLDTTSRCLTRHGGDVILSDTVGFIRRLPERLFASFQSTLAELEEATLLVIVVDASDPERELHLRTTLSLLERMGAHEIPRFYVWNKADRLTEPLARAPFDALSEGHSWLALSSRDAHAIERLREALLHRARDADQGATFFVPYDAAEVLALVYASCRVEESIAAPAGLQLRVRGPRVALERVRSALKERAR